MSTNPPTNELNSEAELDQMWVQIHFKQDSIPSIHAGHLTEESKQQLLAWRDRCVAEALLNSRDELRAQLQSDADWLTPTEPTHE